MPLVTYNFDMQYFVILVVESIFPFPKVRRCIVGLEYKIVAFLEELFQSKSKIEMKDALP